MDKKWSVLFLIVCTIMSITSRNQFIKLFKIVVISETWRKGNGLWMGMKVLNRRNKNGGRIAVNVDKTYLLLQLLTVTDNLLECINNWTLQGKNEKYNSQLYMYTPDPSIQVFKDFTKENNWKRFFLSVMILISACWISTSKKWAVYFLIHFGFIS